MFLGVYSIFLVCLAIFSYAFVDPNLLFLRKLYTGLYATNRPFVTLAFIFLVLIFFGFYTLFLYWFRQKVFGNNEFKFILISTVVFLFLAYPAMVSYDIFNYVATAKALFFYHENPYIIMPIQFLHDPLLLFMQAANKTALYGPFWIFLTGIPYLSGFGNFAVTLFAFKLFNTIFYLASIALLYKMSKNIYYLSFFAFNPLVIFETLVSSHNDIVMMFFAILTIYFLKNKKLILSIILIILSILIKYSTVFLLPVILYAMFYQLRNKKLEWEKIFLWFSISMLVIFLLSQIREEIYPWYAIWFLIFLPFIRNKLIKYIYLSFSFGLLFRYVPFMLLGTYFGTTPLIKNFMTFIPVGVTILFLALKKFIWQKSSNRF
jgi:hypothetical protein